jgi:hypothetical protein
VPTTTLQVVDSGFDEGRRVKVLVVDGAEALQVAIDSTEKLLTLMRGKQRHQLG